VVLSQLSNPWIDHVGRKTELLSKLVDNQKGRRNIFFSRVRCSDTFEDTLKAIALNIGFDMIENPLLNREIWRTTPSIERVQIFIKWLGNPCNEKALLVIDDLDAYEDPDEINKVLTCPARNIIVSTRNSDLRGTYRRFEELRVSQLDLDSTVSIMNGMINDSESELFTPDGLNVIARVIHGHPLAARLVIPFIVERFGTYENPAQEFVELFKSSDSTVREIFWNFKSDDGLSLWDSFKVSYDRLKRRDKDGSASTLLGILPFLKTDSNHIDFFKQDMPWLDEVDKTQLAHAFIFNAKFVHLAGWLSEIRKVSFYISKSAKNSEKILNFHPLVLQFVMLQAGTHARVGFLKQMFTLLYKMACRGDAKKGLAEPHVHHCLQVCDEFNTPLSALGLSLDVLQWLKTFESNSGLDGFAHPDYNSTIEEFITKCANAEHASNQMGSSYPKERSTEVPRLLQLWRNLERHMPNLAFLSESSVASLDNAMDFLVTTVEREKRAGRHIYPELASQLKAFKMKLRNIAPGI
jgi:hypothetical protein